jgi:methylglutaconyl-CoA hydratase
MIETTAPLTSRVHEAVAVDLDGPVLRVHLKPARDDDTLSVAAIDDLIAILEDLHQRPDIRILVLSSLGENFCTGADRKEYQAALVTDPTGAALRRIADKAHRLCQGLETTDAITIARLHGKVIGAGLALASFCDLRVAAETCQFRMPEVGLGLPPAWGGAMGRLIAEAGAARIRELMLTCDTFDASSAHGLGLIHKAVAYEDLDSAVDTWARQLVRRQPEALNLTKRMLAGYARADRTADVSLLDAHLLSAQLARLAAQGPAVPR